MNTRSIRRRALLLLAAVAIAAAAVASCTSDSPPPSGTCADGTCLDASLDVDLADRVTSGDGSSTPDVTSPVDGGTDGSTTSDADVNDATLDATTDAPGDAATADANDGAVVDAGPYTVVTTGVQYATQLVVAAGYVYVRYTGGAVGRVPTGGGTITPIPLPGTESANLITSDATNLYVASSMQAAYKVAHGSTTAQALTGTFVVGSPTQLSSDGTYLYWSDGSSFVLRVPVNAGTVADGGTKVATVTAASGVVTSGSSVFIGEHGPGNLGRIDTILPDGGLLPIATSLSDTHPHQLITDGKRVFFVESNNGASSPIESVLFDGGALRRYANSAAYPTIATDGVSLYYMNGGVNAAAIVKGPVDGTGTTFVAMTTLYGGLGYTSATLAVDATHVYWTNDQTGVLYKAPK